MHSEESLDVLPRHIRKVPFLSHCLPRHIDYRNAFWTPPLSARQAYRLEEKQIQRQFKLPALVSLTDHDNIRAGSMLHVIDGYQSIPISVEWTVPFGRTFFHIGAHNLPVCQADRIMQSFERVTARPDVSAFRNTLSDMNTYRDVLLVLNHPLWDEQSIGSAAHYSEPRRFLEICNRYLHAFELNGLRSWDENRNVIVMANEFGQPAVSGGDRHGCEPNAILNLSKAVSFSEFAEEVRQHRRSHVVFMPQYRQSLSWRTFQTVVDILRDYPSSFAGRHVWTERVFYRFPDASSIAMAALFAQERTPGIFKTVTAVVRIVQRTEARALIRLAMRASNAEWRWRDSRYTGRGELGVRDKLPA